MIGFSVFREVWSLMLVGFGLRDSIMDIARRQYQELQHYTGTIIDDEDATDKERQELDEFLENNSQIERYTHVQFTKMSVPRNKIQYQRICVCA